MIRLWAHLMILQGKAHETNRFHRYPLLYLPQENRTALPFSRTCFFSGCLLNLNKNPCVSPIKPEKVGESIASSEGTSPTWRTEKSSSSIGDSVWICPPPPTMHQGRTRLLIRTLARRPFSTKQWFLCPPFSCRNDANLSWFWDLVVISFFESSSSFFLFLRKRVA